MKIKVASVFAGIEGFGLGFESTGDMEVTSQIEWDKACQVILRRHYPNTSLMGDICDATGTDLGRPDVAAGGFPCQDTSIAAPHRSGLAGRRSRHFYEFTRLVGEYQRVIDESGPRWVVIENPTGLLKSNRGRDMAVVVRSLEELGYGWAYRVVDGRHEGGSPQNRTRVIVVGHRGGDPRPAAQVLGITGPGSEALAEGAHRGSEPGPGPRPIVGGDSLIRVWRKSANPRVSIEHGYEGGYRETWVNDGTARTLTGYDGGLATRQTHLIAQHGRLRTLTLTEWERLQGFPDGWTSGIPDSARYTALGNAMHVGCAEWLGRRIVAVHREITQIGVPA
jgi:DNA (cytosine-5)-methyltransferase 1